MGISKEKAFPRGGFSTQSKKPTKSFGDNSKLKDKELFSTYETKTIKKKKTEKAKKKSKSTDESSDALKVKSVEPLTYEKLSDGFRTLARISEVRELELKLSLPGRLVAHVPITKISNPYNEALKRVTEDQDEDFDLKPLNELFQQGQLVSCCIVKVTKDPENEFFYKVTASLNPSQVNENFFNGQVIMASVKSEEDHGYSMDVGRSHLKAFLPMRKSGKSKLFVGKLNFSLLKLRKVLHKKTI